MIDSDVVSSSGGFRLAIVEALRYGRLSFASHGLVLEGDWLTARSSGARQ
jgi:hypothetical protein